MYLADADKNHPAEAATVGSGTIYMAHNSRGIFAQRNSDDSIKVYSILTVPEFWSTEREKEYNWSNPKGNASQERLDEFYPDWATELRNLIPNFSDQSRISHRPIYYFPVAHHWSHDPGVTLIDDAAHVMSPFSDEGANLPIFGGAKLGEAIARGLANGGGNALEESIQKFEEWMFKRSSSSATASI